MLNQDSVKSKATMDFAAAVGAKIRGLWIAALAVLAGCAGHELFKACRQKKGYVTTGGP